ncbi:C2 domain-containing protein [Gigaspora rosea]|uniref:C2 domain-containing protein n=1 Tax=Gigaspora rosea TaxID=44941 RepID=A0A397UUC5_9GLOM|nr:C2 domain-containing protein [Gigaspora rosea]
METTLRIGVLSARELAAADKDGFSDPYAVIRVANKKYATAVIKKNLNPIWNTTFDIKLVENVIPPHITITVWDKDRFGRDFLGEVTIPIKQVFARNAGGLNDGLPRAFDDPENMPSAYTLQKRSAKQDVKGDIILKFGIVDNHNRSLEELRCIWESLTSRTNG